jgi:hypothetical protein
MLLVAHQSNLSLASSPEAQKHISPFPFSSSFWYIFFSVSVWHQNQKNSNLRWQQRKAGRGRGGEGTWREADPIINPLAPPRDEGREPRTDPIEFPVGLALESPPVETLVAPRTEDPRWVSCSGSGRRPPVRPSFQSSWKILSEIWSDWLV